MRRIVHFSRTDIQDPGLQQEPAAETSGASVRQLRHGPLQRGVRREDQPGRVPEKTSTCLCGSCPAGEKTWLRSFQAFMDDAPRKNLRFEEGRPCPGPDRAYQGRVAAAAGRPRCAADRLQRVWNL